MKISQLSTFIENRSGRLHARKPLCAFDFGLRERRRAQERPGRPVLDHEVVDAQ